MPQSCFATESNLNLLAKAVGISPWEIRYRNAIRPGQVLRNGQMADDEVFSTLMEQILTLPVMACDPFSPEEDALLTLILTVNGTDRTASFYPTESREMARVISCAHEETL